MASARRGPRARRTGRLGRQRERPGRLRDEAQAGENRAEPPSLLQVQRHQQDLGGAEGTDRDKGEIGSGDAAVFEQGQVEQRRPGPALPDHERGQQQGRAPPSSAGWMACSVSPARTTARTSRATPAVTVTAPGMSSCPPRPGGSAGSRRIEASSGATPIGTLTKKTAAS